MANISGGSIVWNLDIDNTKFNSKLKQASSDIEGVGTTSTKTSKTSNAAFESIAKVGIAAVAAAAIAAGALIAKNIGNAVKRVDTLNNFPKIMTNLGYSTEESAKAIGQLDMGVRGLPTSLDQIASAMQNIAPSTTSLQEATDLSLALNNALIAGGKPAELQASAMEQFSQAIAKGKPDMMEWRSLATAMPGQMKQLANSLGYDNWQKMADAVSDGVLPFSKVTDAIVDLNKKGLGDFPSFADQAKNSAGGLQTGIANMNTAISRGVAKVIQSIGSDEISGAFANIGKSLETALTWFAGFVNFISTNSAVFMPIIVSVTTIIGLLTAWFVASKILAAGQAILNAVMAANPIGLIIIAIVGLIAGILYLWNNVEGFRNFFIKAWELISGAALAFWDFLKNIFQTGLDWIKSHWDLIATILFGPIGFAVSMIIKHFDKIKSVVQTVWNWITGIFGKIGDIGTSVVKGAVNSVIGFAERTINGFIRLINGALNAINKIPGVNIGSISELSIPRLAQGGIVPATSGGRLALIGEGGEDEAVIPLSKLRDLNVGGGDGGNVQVTVNMQGIMARSRTDLRDIGVDLIEAVNEGLRAKNLPQIGGGKILEVATNG